MKRTVTFVEPVSFVRVTLHDGEELLLPVVPGIIKTLSTDDLSAALTNASAAEKYTHEALRKAPWPALKHFPTQWLKRCMSDADLTPTRRQALRFMLGESDAVMAELRQSAE